MQAGFQADSNSAKLAGQLLWQPDIVTSIF